MACVINFLSVDAQLPLEEGGEVNFKASAGFKKAPATLEPAFDGAVTAYDVVVPKGTTHVSIGATSFAASVKINGTPGNMLSVDIRAGAAVSIVLEKPAGEKVNEYVLTPKISDTAGDVTEVKFEKAPVPAADAAPHTHSHGGVACTADHSQDAHGHSHDGGKTECKEDHGHGHGHGEKKEESHGHSHDGGKTECKEDHGHGHGHGEKKEESHGHGHSHDGGKTECKEDHGHGHGHGEKK